MTKVPTWGDQVEQEDLEIGDRLPPLDDDDDVNNKDENLAPEDVEPLQQTSTKTIVGTGKGGHQINAIFGVLFDLGRSVLPEALVSVIQMVTRVQNILEAPVFDLTVLEELKQLCLRIYDKYERFGAPMNVPIPPNWRRFLALSDLIAFAGPPVTGNTRSWEARHVLLRTIHMRIQGQQAEAQALKAVTRHWIFSLPCVREFCRYPQPARERRWPDLTLPVQSALPNSQLRVLRQYYEEELAVRCPRSDLATLPQRVAGFDSIFLAGRAIRQGTFVVRNMGNEELMVICAQSYWAVTPDATDSTKIDYFVLGRCYRLDLFSVTDLFAPATNLSFDLEPAHDTSVLLPFRHSDSSSLLDAQAYLFDLLLWVRTALSSLFRFCSPTLGHPSLLT